MKLFTLIMLAITTLSSCAGSRCLTAEEERAISEAHDRLTQRRLQAGGTLR
jgi:hypothetical protein